PVRIGLFAPYDLSRPGGVGTHIRAQARALRARGHDVLVCGPASAPLGHGEVRLGGSTIVTFGGTESGIGLDPRSASRVRQLFRSQALDIAHVHEPLTPLAPWCVVLMASCPVVATFHVHREQGHRWYPLARPLLAPLMRRIACRIAVSEAARRTVAREFPGRYDIVPNGIDLHAFQTARPRPIDVAPDRPHVLYVGRLEPRKGVDGLIRAMPLVQQRRPDAQLLIVGDGPERHALESLAATLGANVRFVGRVDDEQLPAYMQASQIVCSPAIGGESFGIVLLEAMACGTPVVASDIEGYADLIGGDDSAVLVPPRDVDALGAALAALMGDEPRRRALAARGAVKARDYDWSAIAGRLENIYQSLRRP
ncbi:MAG: glycosyltransferase family 4 protein, partial [Acidobacteria bacterium]|nr:glycosyltransferase family 4 protein [Acidobacteriota bacterium]